MNPHGAIDIFQFKLAQILECKIKPIAEMVQHCSGDGHAPWWCYALQSCRQIDTVAKHIFAVNDDIPKIDPDPELNPASLG